MNLNKLVQLGLLSGAIFLVSACDRMKEDKPTNIAKTQVNSEVNPLDIAEAIAENRKPLTLTELYEKDVRLLTDDEILDTMDVLPDTEQTLLNNYILRHSVETSFKEIEKIAPESLPKTDNIIPSPGYISVKNAIEEQKTWEDKHGKPTSVDKFPVELLNASAIVSSTNKKIEGDNVKIFEISLEIENTGDVPIKGISGDIEIHNQENQFLGEVAFNNTTDIAPKSKVTIVVPLSIEEKLQSLNTIWTSKDEELKYQISFKK